MSGRDVSGRGYLSVGGGKRAGGGEVDGEAVCHWRAGMRVMGMDFKRAGGTAGGMGHVVDGGYASRWVGGGHQKLVVGCGCGHLRAGDGKQCRLLDCGRLCEVGSDDGTSGGWRARQTQKKAPSHSCLINNSNCNLRKI